MRAVGHSWSRGPQSNHMLTPFWFPLNQTQGKPSPPQPVFCGLKCRWYENGNHHQVSLDPKVTFTWNSQMHLRPREEVLGTSSAAAAGAYTPQRWESVKELPGDARNLCHRPPQSTSSWVLPACVTVLPLWHFPTSRNGFLSTHCMRNRATPNVSFISSFPKVQPNMLLVAFYNITSLHSPQPPFDMSITPIS